MAIMDYIVDTSSIHVYIGPCVLLPLSHALSSSGRGKQTICVAANIKDEVVSHQLEKDFRSVTHQRFENRKCKMSSLIRLTLHALFCYRSRFF